MRSPCTQNNSSGHFHSGFKGGQWIRYRQQRDAGYHIPSACCNPSLRGCRLHLGRAPINGYAPKNSLLPDKENKCLGIAWPFWVGLTTLKAYTGAALLRKYGLILMSVH